MAIKKKTAAEASAQRKQSFNQEAKSESTSARRLAMLAEESTTLARLVARNPAAPESVLKKLASHADATVRKWVTAHPSTPPSVLVKLATQFPEQLLNNPIFDILLLESPNLLNELPVGARRSLLKREKCPVTFMEWLAADEDEGVQLALAMNPNTPRYIVDRLERSRSARVRASARQHVSRPRIRSKQRDLDEELSEVLDAESPSDRVQEKLRILAPWAGALHAHTDPLRQPLVDWARWRINAEKIAHDTRTPPHMLSKLGRDPCWLVRRWVGGNPSTDSATLEQLARDPNETVRMHVASNPSTPPEVLDLLASDRTLSVRKLVASNGSTSTQTIRRLAGSSDFNVLHAIAMHPETPIDVLLRILEKRSAEDRWKHQRIREEIAKRRKLPPDVLAALCSDSAESVRRIARNNQSTPHAFRVEQDHATGADPVLLQHLSRSQLIDTRVAVASNCRTPEVVLRALAGEKSIAPEVLVAVAKNPSTPADLLEKLGRSRNGDIKIAVAANSAIPASLLEGLVRRWPHDARQIAASRSDIPLNLILFLAKRALAVSWNSFTVKAHEAIKEATAIAGNINVPPTVLESFFSASERFLKSIDSPHPLRIWSGPSCGNLAFALAANPRTPPTVLTRLAKQAGLELEIAENPATPIEVLSALAKDSSPEVRRAATKNLAASHKPQDKPQKISSVPTAPAGARPVADMDRLLAGLPGLASELGKQFAAHDRAIVRRQLATNPALTEEVAARLANDSSRAVKTALAKNPCVPEGVLKILMKDKNKKVSGIAAKRLSDTAPDPEVLERDRRMAMRILQQESRCRRDRLRREGGWRTWNAPEPDPWTKKLSSLRGISGPQDEKLGGIVKGFADDVGRSSQPRFQRLMCLLMAECPTSLLAKSARSTDWKERMAIASHSKTPPGIRKQLAKDGNKFVRAAAREAVKREK